MNKLVDETVARYGRVDAALLNAGIEGQTKPIGDYPADVFDKVMGRQRRPALALVPEKQSVMRAMDATGGSIVITSSTSGIRATPNMSAYTASSNAVIGLMLRCRRSAQADPRQHGQPLADLDTPMISSIEAMRGVAGRNDQPLRGTPLGRYGKPEEVAKLMLFLACDELLELLHRWRLHGGRWRFRGAARASPLGGPGKPAAPGNTLVEIRRSSRSRMSTPPPRSGSDRGTWPRAWPLTILEIRDRNWMSCGRRDCAAFSTCCSIASSKDGSSN